MQNEALSSRPPTSRSLTELRELEKLIAETPAHATVKGMYVESVLSIANRSGVPRPSDKRYFTFKDYPLTELMRIILDLVTAIYPDLPPREGVRRIGRAVYPTLASTTIGKVLFSVSGRNWDRTLSLSPKAWEVSLRPGSVRLVDHIPGSARLEMRDIWNFPDSYQPGVLEGAMETFNVRGSVVVEKKARRCDVDLILTWTT